MSLEANDNKTILKDLSEKAKNKQLRFYDNTNGNWINAVI